MYAFYTAYFFMLSTPNLGILIQYSHGLNFKYSFEVIRAQREDIYLSSREKDHVNEDFGWRVEGRKKVWKANKVQKGVAVIGCTDKMACLGNERPFNASRKQDVGGKTMAENMREVIVN